jgi:protein TonB
MDELRIHYVRPVNPDMEREGNVTVWFLIDSQGAVRKVTATDGDAILAAAAAEAVKRWKYTPYILNGEPVEVETRTVVSFGK